MMGISSLDQRGLEWLLLAFLLTFTLPAAALCAPELLEALWWRFGSDPAVSVLRAGAPFPLQNQRQVPGIRDQGTRRPEGQRQSQSPGAHTFSFTEEDVLKNAVARNNV